MEDLLCLSCGGYGEVFIQPDPQDLVEIRTCSSCEGQGLERAHLLPQKRELHLRKKDQERAMLRALEALNRWKILERKNVL